MSNPDDYQVKGKELALRMSQLIDEEEYDAPILVHALAFMFAALLSSCDGLPCLHEEMGLGLIGDETRLDLFREEVLEMVKALRAKRQESPDPNQPPNTRRLM